jgi:DNA-binding IclR family transcriptional regulator
LSQIARSGLGLQEHGTPFLGKLSQQTRLTAHLAMISQDELVLIDRVAPAGQQQLPTWIGKRLPIHCAGTRKSLMAYMTEEQLHHHFQQGFIRYNENPTGSASTCFIVSGWRGSSVPVDGLCP